MRRILVLSLAAGAGPAALTAVSGGVIDQTPSYRVPEDPPATHDQSAPLIAAAINAPDEVAIGSSAAVELIVTNNDAVHRPITGLVELVLRSYRGDRYSTLAETLETRTVPPGVSTTFVSNLLEGSLDAFADSDVYVSAECTVSDAVTGDPLFLGSAELLPVTPAPGLMAVPLPQMQIGSSISVVVAYENPLSMPLTNVTVEFVSDGSVTLQDETVLVVPVADTPNRSFISRPTVNENWWSGM